MLWNKKIRLNLLMSFAAVALLGTAVLPSVCSAAAGDLDSSFGIGGLVVTELGSAEDVVMQPDGKIVVAGWTDSDFALARYNSDGNLDTGFGTGGVVITDFGSDRDIARGLVIGSDGKIVVAGEADSDFALARYNSDGSLDTTFDDDGLVTTDFDGYSDFARGLVIRSDGKIVVAGSTSTSSTWGDFGLACYNIDGSLDTSFGTNGLVTTNFGSINDHAHALALQSDGKIVVAGVTLPGSVWQLALARYDTDGSLDTSFGKQGLVTTDFGAGISALAYELAIQADGSIVVVGYVTGSSLTNIDLLLARYDSDGNLDTTFDADGLVTTDFGNDLDNAAFDIVIQPDHRIIVAGYAISKTGASDYALARYETSGKLDTGFGTGGLVATDHGYDRGSAAALALQPDGRIVVAGYLQQMGTKSNYFAVARYQGDSWTPPGEDVVVTPVDPATGETPVTLTFEEVTEGGGGVTTVTSSTPNEQQGAPEGFKFGNPPVIYEITTTADYEGNITICFDYSGASYGNEANLRLYHRTDGGWVDITNPGYPDTINKIICGTVSSLSPFAIFEPKMIDAISAPLEPVQVNTMVEASATFSDVGGTHTAVWDWGDGSTSDGIVDEINGIGTVTGSRDYTVPGVYTVTLTLTDAAGESDEAVFQYVVVYDPGAGFVTGGGWIYSDPGAYVQDPTLEGKANFGFVSKYKKGASAPTGNTEFRFRAGNLNFHSSSYDWLVVTGSDYAMFKGLGTINGSGEYKFHIWAGDDSPDTFRIKIWTEDESGVETIVYDNGFDQAIGGGSIVIHGG